ncbi:MAG TPA: Na+ dependent nucleoside transporter N-terminal domain-containing protein, partial [Longimicrobiales bacterium]|nr:Na+ dependent nucleoside transporter N-terminal domain-containing protein [Longimicrobiales bacterium]
MTSATMTPRALPRLPLRLLTLALTTLALLGAPSGAQAQDAPPPAPVASQDTTPLPDSLPGAASGVGSGADTVRVPQGAAPGTLARARADTSTTLAQRLQSLLGLAILLLIAWGLSVDRRIVPWRVLVWGLSLQLLFALFILKTA